MYSKRLERIFRIQESYNRYERQFRRIISVQSEILLMINQPILYVLRLILL